MKRPHQYTITYGVTGLRLDCAIGTGRPNEYTVRTTDPDTGTVAYVTRNTFAVMLRAARATPAVTITAYTSGGWR